MKKTLFLVFSIFCLNIFSQHKQITLDDIWKTGTFRSQYLSGFHNAKQGDFYYVVTNRGQKLDKYSYQTLEKVETLVDASKIDEIPSLTEYQFSDDETKLIIATEKEQIYRRSSKAIYFVYDLTTKELIKISDNQIQEPTFSPDGKKVAYVFDNNIYYINLSTQKTIKLTHSTKGVNGLTDWVYEEEFSFVRAFKWNPNSDVIAYLNFDESDVPEFSMDIYGHDLYPKQQVFKYPKAGEKNAKVEMHLVYVPQQDNAHIHLERVKTFEYIPRFQWTNEPYKLCVTTLNRHQNDLNLFFIDVLADSFEPKIILNEKDKAYVDISDHLTFLTDNSFIWTSEKDGFNHIYHYSENGQLINQVTKGCWEVTNYYGYDKETNTLYFQSTQDGSINRTVSSIKLNGKKLKKLSTKKGYNSADFSTSFNYYINTYSSAETPPIYTLNKTKTGQILKIIQDNADLKNTLNNYQISQKEYSTITTKNGTFNMWMMKPTHFDSSKKHPLFMYQYSGPGSQEVVNRWYHPDDYWYSMLTQKGYIVACIDGRGTGGKGRDFKKTTQLELGKYEIEDQIDAAKKLGQLDYIDQNRIGIWGWSFGGYMSSLAITKGADTFKMAIAVAPVTSWRFYDSIYTERYMTTPQENATGYDQNSPLNFAHLLKGNYLLIHGSGDDNVHVQNTLRMVDALIKADKQFEFFIYPDRTHSIYSKRNDRFYLYTKMTQFIERNL